MKEMKKNIKRFVRTLQNINTSSITDRDQTIRSLKEEEEDFITLTTNRFVVTVSKTPTKNPKTWNRFKCLFKVCIQIYSEDERINDFFSIKSFFAIKTNIFTRYLLYRHLVKIAKKIERTEQQEFEMRFFREFFNEPPNPDRL